MKIAVAGFQHETNRFSPLPTTLHDFEREDGWPGLTTGSDLFEVFPRMNIPLGGFLNYTEKTFYAQKIFEIEPVLWASAEPGGLVEDKAFDYITERILDGIDAALPLAGIYLDLHGAMVTESFEDGDGEFLSRLREAFDFEIPVVVSLDLHANLTEQMIDMVDGLTIFRTYPHLDMAETGYRAGEFIHEILQSGRKPHCAFRKLPLLIPLQSQCTDLEPTKSIYQKILSANSPQVVHADIAMGFPPSDIAQSGPAVVAYSHNEDKAEKKADQVERIFLRNEHRFDYPLYSEDAGVELALEKPFAEKPVILADVQDNSGAGAASDSTGLLHALVKHRVRNCALGALYDLDASRLAHQVGVGGKINCSLGGKSVKNGFPPPFRGKFKVAALSNGRFEFTGEMMRGVVANIGPTAALELMDEDAEICIVVTSERIQCLDQALFTHLGIDPTKKSILVIKSTVHFRADFAQIADEIILIESPGLNPCRLSPELLPRLRPGVRIL